jgi:hypothetical protein
LVSIHLYVSWCEHNTHTYHHKYSHDSRHTGGSQDGAQSLHIHTVGDVGGVGAVGTTL